MAGENEPDKSNVLKLVRDHDVVPLTGVRVAKETLEKVLEHLQKSDPLFDYNVPNEKRDPGKEDFQEFLVRTYLQSNFEITGEEAVKKYLRRYDFVGYAGNGPGFEYVFYLKPGMKGVIKNIDLNQEFPIIALWEPCDKYPKEKEMMHKGDDLSLLPKGMFRKERISNKVELLAEAAPGRLIEPTAVSFKYSYYLPVGTRGIVTGIDNSAELPVSVIFGNTEGYIHPSNGILDCKYGVLKLFRENKMDIRKLLREFS